MAEFTRLLTHKTVHILDIPDEYQYMDSELVDILTHSVSAYLKTA